MDSATIDALYRKRRYSTSSQDGAKEFALPVSQVILSFTQYRYCKSLADDNFLGLSNFQTYTDDTEKTYSFTKFCPISKISNEVGGMIIV